MSRDHEQQCHLSAERLEELVRERYQRPLPRRFYKDVAVEEVAGGYRILLDERPLRTPLKRTFMVPVRALAEAIAAEWRAQKKYINPAEMPLTGLANAAIDKADAAAPDSERPALLGHLRELAAHDLLCYRADAATQGPLAGQQSEQWDALLDWAATTFAARLHVAQGIMPVEQPAQALDALLKPCAQAAPFPFIAVFSMATLTRSLVLALAVWHGRLTARQAWETSTLEERWNMRMWGEDAQAAAQLAARERDFLAAAQFLAMVSEA